MDGAAASDATPPGTVAMCSASWPSDHDFSCGFHARCASGTRSRTRLVVSASCSSSCTNALLIVICFSPRLTTSLIDMIKSSFQPTLVASDLPATAGSHEISQESALSHSALSYPEP